MIQSKYKLDLHAKHNASFSSALKNYNEKAIFIVKIKFTVFWAIIWVPIA